MQIKVQVQAICNNTPTKQNFKYFRRKNWLELSIFQIVSFMCHRLAQQNVNCKHQNGSSNTCCVTVMPASSVPEYSDVWYRLIVGNGCYAWPVIWVVFTGACHSNVNTDREHGCPKYRLVSMVVFTDTPWVSNKYNWQIRTDLWVRDERNTNTEFSSRATGKVFGRRCALVF